MKLLLQSLLLVAFVTLNPLASAQDTFWLLTSGTGTYQTNSNWDGGSPTASTIGFIGPDTFFVNNLNTTLTVVVDPTATPVSPTALGLMFTDFGLATTSTVNLSLSSPSTLTVVGTNSDFQFNVDSGITLNIAGPTSGSGAGGTIVLQNGAVNVGDFWGSGTLNMNAGTLDASVATINIGGFLSSASGIMTQQAGTTVLARNFIVGQNGGTGTYTMNGGTLTISNSGAFILGDFATGTFTQTGGAVTVGTGATTLIGFGGTGTYNLKAGTVDFKNGFTVGTAGLFAQTGGTLTSEAASTIGAGGNGTFTLGGGTSNFNSTLAVNGILNLNGGTLKIDPVNLTTTGAGILNFGGGTLKFTNGPIFVDPFSTNHTLAANSVSTIDASLGTMGLVVLDNLTGSGGITFLGTDGTNGTTLTTFFLGGTNNYTGATTIAGGTLVANGADIANSSSLNINGSTSVLNLTLAAGGLGYAGALSGNGALQVNFNTAGDTLAIQNASTFTGNISLGDDGANQGNLQVYNGTFGNISENTAGSGLTVGGALPGALTGAFTPPSSGTVTIGAGTYTGLTTVNNGFTFNATSLAADLTNSGLTNISTSIGGNVTNTATGTLYTPSIGGNVTNAGALGSNATLTSVLNTPTLTIGGTLSSTGTLIIRSTGINADYFNVLGASANLAGSTVQLLNGSGTGVYTIVHTPAAGDLTGFSQTVTGTLFSYTVAPDGANQDLILSTTQTPTASFATTPNQLAVAGAIDPLSQQPPAALAPILAALNNLPASQIPTALDQLSPESLQYARNIAFENSNFLAQRVGSALANLRAGYGGLDTTGIGFIAPGFDSGLGRSLSSLLAYSSPGFHPSAPNGVNYYPEGSGGNSGSGSESSVAAPKWDSSSQTISDSPDPMAEATPLSRDKAPAFSVFVSGDVVLADLNQSQSAVNAPSSKASYTAGNATAGVSFRMTSNLAAGVLFDYSRTQAKTDSYDSKTDVNTYSPGVYATYFNGGFYANGLFSFGYNDYSNTRFIPLINSTAHSSPSGQQYVSNLDLGYDFHPDKHWVVGPEAGLTYTHVDIDSFTETGAGGADLTVNSQSADSLRSRLGGHVSYWTQTGSVILQPSLTAMWQHEYLADSSGITSQFNIPGSGSFTINTVGPNRNSALLGCGLTATLDNSMSLYLNYIADVGASDFFAQSVIGGFKARF